MADEALQIEALWSGINDPTTGQSYSGAIVATFASGTSTAKAVFEDKGKTLPTAAGKSHASPSIRRFARELGVDLSSLAGSGRKGRIKKDDVKAFVKSIMAGGVKTAINARRRNARPTKPATVKNRTLSTTMNA